ncbi:hypothetical protein, partial [Pseudomonas kilonensis]
MLAMTAAHPTLMQADPLLSRASFAPTGFALENLQIIGGMSKSGHKKHPSGCFFCARILCPIPVPTLDLRQPPISRLHKPPLWEQSLLAMTAAHPTLMQADPLLSRASFAPTGFALENLQIIGGMSKSRHKKAPFGVLFCAPILCPIPAPALDLRQTPISRLHKPPLWEQSLLAMTAAHPTLMQADPLLSRASFAPTGFALENLQIIGGMSKSRHKKAPFGVLFCAPILCPIPAPTLDLRQTSISRLHKPPLWEQSLLAMTAAHPTLMQADPLLSRASFAPT